MMKKVRLLCLFGDMACWVCTNIRSAVPEANTILRKPVLYIGTDNFITAASDTANQMKAFVPDLKVRKLDAGHWVMLQKKAEVNGILGEFFQG